MNIASQKPRVSVVIPAHNAERFIAEALDGVFAQSLRPAEVIVVDDGSNDGTEQVIRSYRFTEDRANTYCNRIKKLAAEDISAVSGEGHVDVVYQSQKKRGPAAARNEGIHSANGNFIAFLDADDFWLPHCLRKLMDCLEEENRAVLAYADGLNFNDVSGTLGSAFSQQSEVRTGLIDDPFQHFIFGNRILTGAVLVRRECIEDVGGFDERIRYGEDQELWLRLALMGPFVCEPSIVMLRRWHEENISNEREGLFYESGIHFLESLWCRYGDRIANAGVNMAHVLRLARRHMAYWHYTRGQYVRALRSLWRFWARTPKSRLDTDASEGWGRRFEKEGQLK
jgi:glycosyltransferase involved in cell wall biosynthesis